jgi:HD-GYP domain-containing protein (c-di-GMP phosphodiesterase class II)
MSAIDTLASQGNLVQVQVEDLIVGMFVARLDRPWLETPYALQGLYLRTEESIKRIAEVCEYVFVDPRRYDTSLVDLQRNKVRRRHEPRRTKDRRINALPRTKFPHKESADLRSELRPAKAAIDIAVDAFDSCLEQVVSGEQLDVQTIEASVKPIVASVVRNKDAAAALVRLRNFDQYEYSHGISCAVWAALLGKELGYPPEDMETLAIGCSLIDIGKTRLPQELLQKPKVSEEELTLLRSHVELGLQVIHEAGLSDVAVTNILKTHHERFDGSGYPNELTNNEIPIFGRIAGIVDSYDAMISPRVYQPARPSYEALLELERNNDRLFQAELIEYFIHAIGIFPVGSVVELNSGEIGIVVEQFSDRRLRPKVMLILDENRFPRNELTIINLGAQDGSNQTRSLWITHELPKGSHGINASQYFL